ncbi:MAG: heparinase II/III family protein, partial [Limisphaerales bacterium]
GAFALAQSGYYGFRGASGFYVVYDGGEMGPEYLPGHGHADLFSFELSLKGKRVIVDTGTYGYENGQRRVVCRSTRAHNTVEIEGQDQSEMWGAFRVGRRATPHDICCSQRPEGLSVSGWHDGYLRFPFGGRHERAFAVDGERIRIRDRVEARQSVTAVSRLHLHPDCRVLRVSQGDVHLGYPNGRFAVRSNAQSTISIEDTEYHPEFGRSVPNLTIAMTMVGRSAELEFTIEDSIRTDK